MLERYGFIMQHHSYEGRSTRHTFETPKFSGTVVSVGTVDEAIKACNKLVEEGTQLIELCSGFSEADQQHIKDNLKVYVPIGRVTFNSEDSVYVEKNFE